MKLLLDTHVWIWALLEPVRLPARVSRELISPQNERWLSPMSVWEVLLLCEKNRLALRPDPWSWIHSALLIEAPFDYSVAQEAGRVKLTHRDPVDRFLVATARVYGLTLVTADERLLEIPDLKVLAAR